MLESLFYLNNWGRKEIGVKCWKSKINALSYALIHALMKFGLEKDTI
jgi:hypothetical protein